MVCGVCSGLPRVNLLLVVGGLTPPPPLDPAFILGKSEIYKRKCSLGLLWVHNLSNFWVPGPPHPPQKNSGGGGGIGRGARAVRFRVCVGVSSTGGLMWASSPGPLRQRTVPGTRRASTPSTGAWVADPGARRPVRRRARRSPLHVSRSCVARGQTDAGPKALHTRRVYRGRCVGHFSEFGGNVPSAPVLLPKQGDCHAHSAKFWMSANTRTLATFWCKSLILCPWFPIKEKCFHK